MNRMDYFHRQLVDDDHLEWESQAIRNAIRYLEGDAFGGGIVGGLEVIATGNPNEIRIQPGIAYSSDAIFETAEDPGTEKFSERIYLMELVDKSVENILGQEYRILLRYKETRIGPAETPVGGGEELQTKIIAGAEIVSTTEVTIPAGCVLLAVATGTGVGNPIVIDDIDETPRVYIGSVNHGHTGGDDGPILNENALGDKVIKERHYGDQSIPTRAYKERSVTYSKLETLLRTRLDNHHSRHLFGGADAFPWGSGGGIDVDKLDGHHYNSGWENQHLIPSGTKMVFVQATAPAGWTQDKSQNDRVLRVVSGNGGGIGGGWTISGLSSGGAGGHSHSQNSTGGGGGHSHSQENTGGAGQHFHYMIGAHYHSVSIITSQADSEFNAATMAATKATKRSHKHTVSGNTGQETASLYTRTQYNHSHSNPNTSGVGNHAHSNPNTRSVGNHAHSVSQNGGWRPSYQNVLVCRKN